MAPFMQILTNATIIAAFGNDHTAMLMYDTKTVPVRPVPGAECVTVENGKTTRSWFVVTGPVRGAETLAHTPPGRAHTPCRITPPRWLDDGDAVESPAADSASVCGRRACDQRVGAGRLRATR